MQRRMMENIPRVGRLCFLKEKRRLDGHFLD
jgi:hypothetical protein